MATAPRCSRLVPGQEQAPNNQFSTRVPADRSIQQSLSST
jgi:hypothetical protein